MVGEAVVCLVCGERSVAGTDCGYGSGVPRFIASRAVVLVLPRR